MQGLFARLVIKKRYTALLGKEVTMIEGVIDLPLLPDMNDRPRQKVDLIYGKSAITHFEVIEQNSQSTRVHFFPLTGRTHQLRMHAAHPDGLDSPTKGDELYGKKDERLFLHADLLSFEHPITGVVVTINSTVPF